MCDPMDLEICAATATHAPVISAVIVESLRATNAKDYPPDVIERIAGNFSPGRVRDLLAKRDAIVAVLDGRVVGTASLDGDVVRTVFVAPDVQDRGVDVKLMRELERRARARGLAMLSVSSSITAEGFYAKLGFVAVRDSYHGAERTIIMVRSL
ncbi:MAG: GNAT family N-acetyltransferase [Reyranellaceae bacterium]